MVLTLAGKAPVDSEWCPGPNRRVSDEAAAKSIFDKVILLEEGQKFYERNIVEIREEVSPVRFHLDVALEIQQASEEGEKVWRNYRTWLSNFAQRFRGSCKLEYVRGVHYSASITMPDGTTFHSGSTGSFQLASRKLYPHVVSLAEGKSFYERFGPPLSLPKPQGPSTATPSIGVPELTESERIQMTVATLPAGMILEQVIAQPGTAVLNVYVRLHGPNIDERLATWREELRRRGVPINLIPKMNWLDSTGLREELAGAYILRHPSQIDEYVGRSRTSPVAVRARPLPPMYKLSADRRNRDTFSIDPPNSLDVDDAISFGERPERPLPPGQTWVGIHIAAAADFVSPNDAIEQAAIAVGAATYGRSHIKGILPPDLAFDLASLHTHVDRLAFTVYLRLDENDRFVEIDLFPERSLIRNRRRYTYRDIDDTFAGLRSDHRTRILQRLGQATAHLKQIRTGSPESAKPEAGTLVSELMILANSATGLYLQSEGVPFFRLLNPAPNDEEFAFDMTAYARWLADTVTGYSNFRFKPEKTQAGADAVTATGRASTYSVTEGGHWSIGSPVYGHFSSPLRRAADLVNQGQLARFVDNKPHRSVDALRKIEPALNDAIIRFRRTRQRRQLSLEKLKRTLEKVGQTRTVTVTAVGDGEIRMSGEPAFSEGYVERAFSHRRLKVGDRVDVILSGVDLEREGLLYLLP